MAPFKSWRIVALVVLTIFGFANFVSPPNAHGASVGLVCLAGPQDTNCPSTPLAISATSGTQLTVAVNVQGSGSLNGFDILVKADPNVLHGSSLDLTGSVLGSNTFEVAKCIDFAGFGCSPENGIGVVEFAAVALGSSTTSPTTGRLFSITYNATKNSSAVNVDFQTGCSKTSALPDFCVTVAIGANVVPETVQGSTGIPGDFSVYAVLCCSSLSKNSNELGSIVLQSENGFFGGLSISFSVSPVKKAEPIAFLLDSGKVFLGPGTSTQLLFTIDTFPTTPPVVYTLSVTATSGLISHSATITFRVLQR